jgi:hypothetical protein
VAPYARRLCLAHRAGDVLDIARIDRSRHDSHDRGLFVRNRRRKFTALRTEGSPKASNRNARLDLLHASPPFSVSGGLFQHLFEGGTTVDAVANVSRELEPFLDSLIAITSHRELCDFGQQAGAIGA